MVDWAVGVCHNFLKKGNRFTLPINVASNAHIGVLVPLFLIPRGNTSSGQSLGSGSGYFLLDPDPGFMPGSGSGFQISQDPGAVSAPDPGAKKKVLKVVH